MISDILNEQNSFRNLEILKFTFCLGKYEAVLRNFSPAWNDIGCIHWHSCHSCTLDIGCIHCHSCSRSGGLRRCMAWNIIHQLPLKLFCEKHLSIRVLVLGNPSFKFWGRKITKSVTNKNLLWCIFKRAPRHWISCISYHKHMVWSNLVFGANAIQILQKWKKKLNDVIHDWCVLTSVVAYIC